MFESMSHIGIVVDDLDTAVAEWTGRFGLKEIERLDVESEGIRCAFVSPGLTRHEAACVELIEPTDKSDLSNIFSKRLAETGEGVFHVAFRVDDVESAGRRLREHGVEAIDLPPAAEGEGRRVVIHPRSANGLLLELM